ncbi:MAG: NAD(P)/FAD-dependent oxidoreductase [Syntrophobacteraceae bacterium]|jgi:hypothetical protein|nr:NAD(P)/FAD-dependent oxidoreductase [Syntrophobacteraceae bacterium]MCU0588971.1 NAD(P)/FAD-dependent oxidoreductase [Syntrophobacteraceae bacterium]
MTTDVIIVGAGASGLLCAMEAGRRGRSVLVLDHSMEIGRKILVSGGGRCNFTNRSVSRDHYICGIPDFPVSALSRYTSEDFTALLDQHGIGYHEKEAGQLFCDDSSRRIVDMLKLECDRASVRFLLDCKILEVRRLDGVRGPRFSVAADLGSFESSSLVIATGGLSWPGLGATSFGQKLARGFGIRVTPLRPGLTPLKFSREDAEHYSQLSGISVPAAVSCGGTRFEGFILFTHRGLSGPAVLQLSSYWDGKSPIEVDLLPRIDVLSILSSKRGSRMHLHTLLGRLLPDRLAKLWCRLSCHSRPLNQCSARDLEEASHRLHHWEIRPGGTEGFNKAEVTRGGVDTRELSSRTMECNKVPGLYFTGEVTDVTGQLGGYNLHWAWASGHAAGEVA